MEDKNINSKSVETSRRRFLKASAAVAATAVVLEVSSVSGLLASTAKLSQSKSRATKLIALMH